MNEPIIIHLFQNIAILLAFSMLYENFWIKHEDSKTLIAKIITGLILGGIGGVLMFTPWTLVPGIVFDTRSVMLSIAGLFFGRIPTFIAMAIIIALRIYIAGDGMMMGIVVIIVSGTIGLLWRRLRPAWKEKNYMLELLAMGIITHLLMLALTIFLPSERIIPTIKTIAFPILILYPPATMLLGILMLRQWTNFQNQKANDELRESTQFLNNELMIAKEKAEESDRLKSSFLSNLSHEIRTPMNAILGFTVLLTDPDLSKEKRENYNSIIQHNGNHLLSIIDDIIEISKIETKQVTPNLSIINLNNFFDELSLLMSVNLPKDKKIELRTKIPPDNASLSFKTDEVKLKQIMINLISNAIKFTDTGFVEFGYEVNEKIIFFVRDTGIGIDKVHHEMIFERFRQVDGDNSIIKGGSGLGLAIAKAYTLLLGGQISIESETGNGSLFKVTFPLIKIT